MTLTPPKPLKLPQVQPAEQAQVDAAQVAVRPCVGGDVCGAVLQRLARAAQGTAWMSAACLSLLVRRKPGVHAA